MAIPAGSRDFVENCSRGRKKISGSVSVTLPDNRTVLSPLVRHPHPVLHKIRKRLKVHSLDFFEITAVRPAWRLPAKRT